MRAALVAAATLSGLSAQGIIPVPMGSVPEMLISTDPMFPDPLDEGITAPLALGFSLTLPGGMVVTDVQATSNGRILAGTTPPVSDFSPSMAELLTNPFDAICPLWYDLEGVTVFYDTVSVPGTAIITWQDVVVFGGVDQFTFQCQLASSGEITFAYDDRVSTAAAVLSASDAIVGVSPGNGAVDPGEVDFSTISTVGVISGGSTLYEEFSVFIGGDPIDLIPMTGSTSGGLQFIPGGGGYTVVGNLEPVVAGSADPGRVACTALPPSGPLSVQLIPTTPGYVLTPGTPFDTTAVTMGTPMALLDDEIVNMPISFSFPMPGGGTVTSLDLDSNGRLVQPGMGEFSDFSASIAEFLGDPVQQIAVFWADINPGAGGTVYAYDNGASATFTWEDVPQFGAAAMPANTFQVAVDPSGTINLRYEAIAYDDSTFSALLGTSPGNGAADPDGESDWTSATATSADDVIYELFDGTGVDIAAVPPLPNGSVQLFAVNTPVVGTTFETDIIDFNGTAAGAVYLFGFPAGLLAPPLNLGFLNPGLANCEVLVDILTPGALIASPSGTPGTPTAIIAIPALPSLAGISGLVVQALVLDPTLSPTLFPTDELVLTIGNL